MRDFLLEGGQAWRRVQQVWARRTETPVLVDFALQGGGSHGAFTWGVLDRLLEEPWLKVEAISGHVRRRDERGRAGQRL